MKVDTGWFNGLIKRSSFGSQRRLAQKIRGRQGRPLDPAALSLMLRGKRAMQIDEAQQFASLLDVPLIEVLKHAGVALPNEGARSVQVIGTLDKDGDLSLTKSKEFTPGPPDLPPDAVAVRWQTARSEHDLVDGWIVFAEKPGPLTPSAIGRFCIVQPKKGAPGVAFVTRGYRAGSVNIQRGLYGALEAHENVFVDWIAPVLWIKPQQ